MGEKAGRIGLTMAKQGSGVSLFAVIDNQSSFEKKAKEEDPLALTKDKLKKISKEDFLKLDKKIVSNFLKANGFPEKYKATDIFDKLKEDKISTQTLLDFVDNGDDGFSKTDILQAEIYRSDDDGKTWKRTHEAGTVRDLFFTYGYYFAQIRANPSNPNKLYVLGTRIITSDDGGKLGVISTKRTFIGIITRCGLIQIERGIWSMATTAVSTSLTTTAKRGLNVIHHQLGNFIT
ncbi:MAG: hypothetical protein HC817_10505 [Saprospiraceae bacterium]|nr:hypothetical protein [Saprospiraceae bacterium]